MAYALACRALTVSALELLAPQSDIAPQAPPGPPPAEVYFINMDERVDKCRCMRRQLKDSPWPTHRFPAVSSVDVNATCPTVMLKLLQRPNMRGNAMAMRSAAKACSNVKVWERFLETSQAPYLVVFEDDTIINGTALWGTVSALFEANCTNWDYLMVDSWKRNQDFSEEAFSPSFDPALGCDDLDMNRLNFHFSGSHMQVMTRRAVEALMAWVRAPRTQIAVMDKLAALVSRYKPVQAWQVSLNLTSEARFVPELAGEICFDSVWEVEDGEPSNLTEARFVPDAQWGWNC